MNKNNTIYIDELIKYDEGMHKGKINWGSNINRFLKVLYGNKEYCFCIKDYTKGENKIILELDGRILKPIFTGHLLGCKIGGIIGIKSGDFKYEIGQVFKDDKRYMIIIDREYRDRKKINNYIEKQKWYKYRCDKSNWNEGWIDESSLLRNGCSCCNGKTVVEGINDIPNTAPNLIRYFQNGIDEAKLYTKCGGEIYPICPDCGIIKSKKMKIATIYRSGISCACGDCISKPNKIMFSVLEQLQVEFETEKTFDWCKYNLDNKLKTGRYDFYINLNDKEYIIEMDGEWHTVDNNINGQTKEKSNFIDSEKDRLAKEHGIEIVRIECNSSNLEYIINSINKSILIDIFDFSKIDWLKVEEFTCTNLVKVACDYKKNNTNMTTYSIGKIMGLSYGTITNYLKRGNSLSWCSYNVKEEITKNSIKIGKANGKKVEIFKDNKSLGIYESSKELERQSLEVFGVKLSQSSISNVCLGKRKQHKGYTFKNIQ